MSWAVFMIEKAEWEHAKSKLEEKLNWAPTKKEIAKEAKAIVLSPELLGICVQKVLNYFFYLDLLANLEKSSPGVLSAKEEPSTNTRLYMKSMNKETQTIIQNQLSHVDNSCLSDPPADVVNIHRQNP